MATNSIDNELGQALVKSGAMTEQQLYEAVAAMERSHNRLLGDELLRMGIPARAVVNALEQQGYKRADLTKQKVSVETTRMLPEAAARRYKVLPLYLEGNTLTVAAFNPNPQMEHNLTVAAGRPVDFAVATPEEIEEAIETHYQRAVNIAAPLEKVLKNGSADLVRDAVAGGENSAVAQTVHLISKLGVQLRASDIHMEPQPPHFRVRYRVDGVLQDGGNIPMQLIGPVVSRIRIMANLDVVEHNTPQDGQMEFKDIESGANMDIRVNILPTIAGPKVVMRLLDKRKTTMSLTDLGFEPNILEKYRGIVRRPYGIIPVVGPTGSGKSTTLMATIAETDTAHLNVTTLEDPVEYKMPGITQTQVNPKSGMTFAAGLRAILRQDPDVIVVGEIRDQETANIAFRAALTGHLVLCTLHATDTVSTISRLIDIGVEPYIISAALNGAMSQRLIRLSCPRCSKPSALNPQERAYLHRIGVKDITEQQKGAGCNHCNFTGFRGRQAAAEILVLTPELERLIAKGSTDDEIRKAAIREGLLTLEMVALDKVRRGLTTVSEVMSRVLN